MCRFLLCKSKQKTNPQQILESFAKMAKKSKAFDGDWQGDGWGISWLDKNNCWQIYKSLKPIWEDVQSIKRLYMTTMFAIHARSATFPQHKKNIEYNQPYLYNQYAFVFNGYLKGVSLSIPGKIGAQKIWFLLRKVLDHPQGDNNKRHKHPAGVIKALEKVKNLLKKNTKQIQALNIGLSDGEKIYALTYYSKHPKYYQLHYYKDSSLQFICSEPLEGYSSALITANQIITL